MYWWVEDCRVNDNLSAEQPNKSAVSNHCLSDDSACTESVESPGDPERYVWARGTGNTFGMLPLVPLVVVAMVLYGVWWLTCGYSDARRVPKGGPENSRPQRLHRSPTPPCM
jgi:hypothetical protein